MRWESFTFPHNYTSLVKKELMTSAVQTEENRKQKREREERENERKKRGLQREKERARSNSRSLSCLPPLNSELIVRGRRA